MAFWTCVIALFVASVPNQVPGELVSLPFSRGDNIFTSRKSPSGGVDFCIQDGPEGMPRILIPATEAPLDAEVPLPDFCLSDDGRYVAYFVTQPEKRYEAIRIIETQTGRRLGDEIKWTHFGDFAWRGNGFYYGAYREPATSDAKYSDERLLYHRLGEPQDKDTIVYEDKDHPKRKYQFLTTFDHRFFLLHLLERVDGKALAAEWFRREGDLQGKFTPLIAELAPGRTYLCDNVGDHLFLYTQYKSPAGRIIDVDTKHPEEKNWNTVLPEPVDDGEPVLGKLAILAKQPGGGNQARVYTMQGKLEKVIPTEPGTTADIQFCRAHEEYVFVSVEKDKSKSYFIWDYKSNRLIPFR